MPLPVDSLQLEAEIVKIGTDIFERSAKSSMSLFDQAYWSGKMMAFSMRHPQFKVQLFRFVDVLPTLKTSEQLVDHLKQYLLVPGLELPLSVKAALGAASLTEFTTKLAAQSIKKNVELMSAIFITGQTVEQAEPVLEKSWNNCRAATVDLLGEAAVSEQEAALYQAKYIALINGLAERTKAWKNQPQLEDGANGAIPRANVSVKCSSLYSQLDNLAYRTSVDRVKERLRVVLRAAMEQNVFVNLDMEQADYEPMFLTIAEELFAESEFEKYPHLGIVIQAYLLSAEADIKRVVAFAIQRKTPITVRLVKGAYWDYETVMAEQRGTPTPVFMQKAATDANYERCAKLLLDSYPHINAAFGSHNVRSLAALMAYANLKELPKNAFEIQMLYGMAEPFKQAVIALGYRIREYAPVGAILPGMAYLVRRLLENTSNEGFLRSTFVEKKDRALLLSNPETHIIQTIPFNKSAMFANEPLRDFSLETERVWIPGALASLRAKLPIVVNPVIDGQEMSSFGAHEVPNPSCRSEIVSKVTAATVEAANQAVEACAKSAVVWGNRPASERVAVIKRAAQLMREQKNELTTLMVIEVGKNFKEADADVAEAIDFCDYYADEMERLAAPRDMNSKPGESNTYWYAPRGLALAIAPWNFPLAILCGMTVAPLVAGNPVIMKPSEQSSAIGLALYKILRDAGVPKEVVQFLPGSGAVIGAHLVKHPGVHIISFTGSRVVGLNILETANKVAPGQKHVKKVVAEMGGKNALIIDEDADLD